ncbi:MAG: MBL fold metallo-hydrolase [Clostridia bacterium]|nr:MBL fold metallo-hydrolase [Clostridia bacterium]
MHIRWLGHASFLLTESTGTAVVTDPYADSVGFQMPAVSAHAVTVSHSHSDHNNVSAVSGSPVVYSTVGSFEVDGVHISAFRTYHDQQKGALRGDNLVFTYRLDGVDVCHLGDIGQPCNARICDAVGNVDVLLVPVGGKYTIDAELAKDYVDKLMPSIVIPMHYKTEDSAIDIEEVDEFLSLFEDEQITRVEGDTITLDRTQFDGDFETQVIVFSR